jgi:hypothetical protein
MRETPEKLEFRGSFVPGRLRSSGLPLRPGAYRQRMNTMRFTFTSVVTLAVGSAHAQSSVPANPPPQTAPLYGGRDGLSSKTAVVIESRSEEAGIRSEYSWIAERYPGYQRVSQALTAWDKSHKRYDIITIKTTQGENVVLWFDISAMFQ